jgi:hypothetical protein
MTFVRDDREARLRDLIVACMAAIDTYDEALELIPEDALFAETVLHPHLASCRTVTARLEACARALGDLPPAPDRDLETFRALGLHAEMMFTADHAAVIVGTLLERERAVLEACDALAPLDLPDDLATTVDDCADRTERAITALETKAREEE